MTENLEAIRRRNEAGPTNDDNKSRWTFPLFSTIRFDYSASTKVKILTKETEAAREMRLVGEIYRNTCDIGMGDSITLINVVDEETGEKFGGHHTFFQTELITIEVIEDSIPKASKPKEIVLDTHQVKTRGGFCELLLLLENEEEVGVYVPGLSADLTKPELERSSPTMVLLNVQNTIIVIPTNVIEDQDFWNVFASRVLQNQDVEKILYDCRPLLRFLDSRGLPGLKNRTDLRLLDACASAGFGAEKKDPQALTRGLKDITMDYLSSFVIEREELWADVVYDEVSDTELTTADRKKLAVQIKYLLMLKEQISKRMFQICNITTESIAMKTLANVYM